MASIKERYRLSKEGSSKETYHLSLDLSGSEISYRPGDTIAVLPQNPPALIEKTLKAINVSADTVLPFGREGSQFPLIEILTKHANLSDVNKSLAKELASQDHSASALQELFLPENKIQLRETLQEHHVWDFLNKYSDPKSPLSAEAICQHLRPLIPRLYSISSAPSSFPNEVHFTITIPIYETQGIKREGVAASYLSKYAPLNEAIIPIYLQPTKDFLLTDSSETPIVMIGPGTGIAPFRGFMQERHQRGDKGKNWLFFGECHRDYEFYYEKEWAELCNANFLRLDLAFSRDQDHKIYVQDRIKENAQELWSWIQKGAIIYICGDAKHMAKDVDKTFLSIFQEEGGLSEDEAKLLMKSLRKEHRYLKDVY